MPRTAQHALLASPRLGQHARPQERDCCERSTGAGRERHLDVPDARQYDHATNNVVREEGFCRGRQRPRVYDGFVQPRLLRARRFEQPIQPGRVARRDKSAIAVERLGICWARNWLPRFERSVRDGSTESKRAQARAAQCSRAWNHVDGHLERLRRHDRRQVRVQPT